jgi:cell division protein ZapE
MDKNLFKDQYLELVQDKHLEYNKSQEMLVLKLSGLSQDLDAEIMKKNNLKEKLFKKYLGLKSKFLLKGIYIYGGVGVGKSMLMDLFYANSKVRKKRRLHFHEFMNEIHDSIDIARREKEEDPIQVTASKIISEADLICLDEMQISDVADAMIVGRVFEHFFKVGLIIVTTSNRHPQDLYKNGLNRQLFLPFITMIMDKMRIENIISEKDFRRHKLSGIKKYFLSSSAENNQEFDNLVQSFNLNKGNGLRLQVKGRQIFFSKFYNGVALIDFNELCSVPLGSLDYYSILNHFKLFFLDKIPQLTRQRNDSAKRFITLIDTVYEKKIELICRAQTTPDTLYDGGENNFEFRRTVSRLFEMQSKDWPGT